MRRYWYEIRCDLQFYFDDGDLPPEVYRHESKDWIVETLSSFKVRWPEHIFTLHYMSEEEVTWGL